MVSQTIADFIHEKGYHAIACNNLEEALLELSQYKIDLVLINFWQPDGTVQNLLEYLDKEKITTSVIVFSHTKEHQSVLECFRVGVLGFVVKLMNVVIFRYKVDYLLTRVNLQYEVKLQRVELGNFPKVICYGYRNS
ncbi:MAG: response regulator [Shewanella sp.]